MKENSAWQNKLGVLLTSFAAKCANVPEAHASCRAEPHNYLIIVRYESCCDAWVVEEDSRHILEDGGGYTPQELRINALRALPQSVPWRDNLPTEEGTE